MAKPIEVDTPAYRRLVKRAKECLDLEREVRFELGDLALQLVPMGATGTNNGNMGILGKFAEDLGISLDRIRSYRQVSAAWPGDTRVSPSVAWATYRQLAASPDRFTLIHDGMTYRDAVRATGQVPHDTSINAAPSEKAAAIRRWVAEDPEVADEIVADLPTRDAIRSAGDRRWERETATVRRRQMDDPVVQHFDARIAENDLMIACSRFVTELREVVPKLDVTGAHDRILDALHRADVATGWARAVVEGTQRSELDAELRELIEQGGQSS